MYKRPPFPAEENQIWVTNYISDVKKDIRDGEEVLTLTTQHLPFHPDSDVIEYTLAPENKYNRWQKNITEREKVGPGWKGYALTLINCTDNGEVLCAVPNVDMSQLYCAEMHMCVVVSHVVEDEHGEDRAFTHEIINDLRASIAEEVFQNAHTLVNTTHAFEKMILAINNTPLLEQKNTPTYTYPNELGIDMDYWTDEIENIREVAANAVSQYNK